MAWQTALANQAHHFPPHPREAQGTPTTQAGPCGVQHGLDSGTDDRLARSCLAVAVAVLVRDPGRFYRECPITRKRNYAVGIGTQYEQQ